MCGSYFSGVRHAVVLLTLWSAVGSTSRLEADDAGGLSEQFQAYLAAGEFGPARALAERMPAATGRDHSLREIAQAQAAVGMRRASLQTTFGINQDGLRSSTFGQLALTGNQSETRGGAALADFDTLIELITSTIAPESWDTVGGPGAVESFPTGVYVDPAGRLKRFTPASGFDKLATVRAAATHDQGNRDLNRRVPLRKVSLTRLERHVEREWALGRDPGEAMRCLAGLQRVQYVFLYPETRDLVIAGPAEGWRRDAAGRYVGTQTGSPVLQLDDWVVALRNALTSDGRFGCAITPRQENLANVQSFVTDSSARPATPRRQEAWLADLQKRLGQQDIRVFGVDPQTRTARILVEADYHMKLIGMGLEEGTVGVESYLDSVTLDAAGNPPAMDVLRWWFTLKYDRIQTTASQDAFQFVGTGVQVLSENELLSQRGERIHTGESSPQNQRFAHTFTRQFSQLAIKYPVYAELRNIFDLALVAALIQREDLEEQIAWEPHHFGAEGAYRVRRDRAPESVESVINHRLLGRRHLIVGVSGGVSVDTTALLQNIALSADDYQSLAPARAGANPRDIPLERWWWD